MEGHPVFKLIILYDSMTNLDPLQGAESGLCRWAERGRSPTWPMIFYQWMEMMEDISPDKFDHDLTFLPSPGNHGEFEVNHPLWEAVIQVSELF